MDLENIVITNFCRTDSLDNLRHSSGHDLKSVSFEILTYPSSNKTVIAAVFNAMLKYT